MIIVAAIGVVVAIEAKFSVEIIVFMINIFH